MQVVIYEPFQHFIPTGRGWVEGFRGLGHSAFEMPSTQYNILKIQGSVDILVIFGPDESIKNDINEFKRRYPSCKIVLVCFGYQPWYAKIESSVSLWVEHTYKHDLAVEQFKSRGLKFANIPLASSKTTFFHFDTDPRFDVSFVGSFAHGNRDEQSYLYPVIDSGYKGFYSGFSYKEKRYPCIRHADLNKIYNATKVNLNFHYENQKEQRADNIQYRLDFNGRIFEVAMCGRFQICDVPFAKDYHFGDSIVVAEKNEWMDTLEYYLKNDDERIEKCLQTQEVARNHHSWENRMQDVINLLT
jgi:hypothetical protein